MQGLLQFFGLYDYDAVMILVFVGIFSVYSVISTKLLFGPFVQLFEVKEKLTTGATSSAQEMLDEAKRLRMTYEEQVALTQKEALQEKSERILHAKKQSEKRVAEAMMEAKNLISAERAKIGEEVQALTLELDSELSSLTESSVEKVLSR